MKRIAGLREIAGQFDLFLVDQFGVLHDGVTAYPGAIEGLAELASPEIGRASCRERVSPYV